MLDRIVRNRTTCIKMDLALNNLQMLICHENQTNNQFCLVWFYDIWTTTGHLMPNPFYTYIKYMISKHIKCKNS